jgi:hypothetical protein
MSIVTVLGLVVVGTIVLFSIAMARVSAASDRLTETQIGQEPLDLYRRYRAAEERATLERLAWRTRRERLVERLDRERVA